MHDTAMSEEDGASASQAWARSLRIWFEGYGTDCSYRSREAIQVLESKEMGEGAKPTEICARREDETGQKMKWDGDDKKERKKPLGQGAAVCQR